MVNATISKAEVREERRKLLVGHRSYITIIKELSGNELCSFPLNSFIIVIYDLYHIRKWLFTVTLSFDGMF